MAREDLLTLPALAITMGDPAGVGPEIIAKALGREEVTNRCRLLVIGSARALDRAKTWTGSRFDYSILAPGNALPAAPGIGLINDESHLGDVIPVGEIDAGCGASAYAWLREAIRLAQARQVDAIVTAPLHKEALHRAGHHYPGHTEILAEACGVAEYCLMLIAGRFRVAHVTCHVALSEVPARITPKKVEETIRLMDAALLRLDGHRPRIAVCALNPHAGEGGLFGEEEIRAIRPAVEACRAEGLLAEGPFPSDSIYPRLRGGAFDGVVAMYHDQGHIAFKLAHFHFDPARQEWSTVTGVNVTLGLPLVRTSVDHGTAFDLAGTGKASEQSLLDALDVAVRLAAPPIAP